MKSEIRDSTIAALSERVRKRTYTKYLSGMRLVKLRGFSDVEVRFDFPVTALIGPNGAGKTTILGAAGLIYDSVPPRRFFAKSGSYDGSMRGWRIEYELIDRDRQGSPSLSRTASYLKAKWNRDAVERVVVISGISRTLPASERKDTYRFIKGDFAGAREVTFPNEVVNAVENILGKAAANYLQVDADVEGKNSIYAVRASGQDEDSYSEFHFGAGEASIIRIVSRIEEAPNDSLLLIEEIENGLHPVATRRLVEYLIEVARRKSCQVIFTTHSNDALAPLPTEAVWSTYRGRVTQGKLDIAALRTLTGQVEAQLAVFTEDAFAAMFAEVTLRAYCQALTTSWQASKYMPSAGQHPQEIIRASIIPTQYANFQRSRFSMEISAERPGTRRKKSQARLERYWRRARISSTARERGILKRRYSRTFTITSTPSVTYLENLRLPFNLTLRCNHEFVLQLRNVDAPIATFT
ncbi:ATP-dependent nuclease [Dermacoccus nishinomiyaensis]|uniref:ATP-dependent nuclease n=1 Tax=Dermacoccus nishinomiyaensis TaxID=1274 RepID=UPI0021A6889F|nr:ATP-binding protein [Dermacoccus nishinomiyaensis]MCT1605082.1 AAA family ATPase [Dermacoccus nishinomiyaensis]